jgi:hypothetical protein
MSKFPTALLTPDRGAIFGQTGDAAIEVPIKPFSLPGQEGLCVTSLILEGIGLSTLDLAQLAGTSYKFPVNPAPGYIDGSIYLSHAHHPVDVTTIRFGEVAEGALSVEIEAVLDLEFEGLDDYERTPWTLHSYVGVR